MTNNHQRLLSAGALITLVALLAASHFHVPSLWSLNQLQYLPDWVSYFSALAGLITVWLIFRPVGSERLEEVCVIVDRTLFGSGRKWPLLLAFIWGAIFYALRIDTHLLGDGYTWLSILGHGETYILKLSEPGAILAVRGLQRLLGEYSEETARAAFQILSVLSGIITIYNLQRIIGRLFLGSALRIFALITFLGSGLALLFMGYVEHYAILWAAVSIFLNLSIKALRGNGSITGVMVSFMIACFMHMQALYFAPAVLYMLYESLSKTQLRDSLHKYRYHLLSAAGMVGLAALFWGYNNFIQFEAMFLPPFTGRPAAPDYAVMSWKHLLDIINLIITILPGILVISILIILQPTRRGLDKVMRFLLVASFGSMLFLFLIDPVLGMARDWDLFSLTLFAPVLTLLYLLEERAERITSRILPIYCLVIVLISVSSIAVNASTVMAETRFHSLLKYYGSKDRGGWLNFIKYFEKRGALGKSTEIIEELNSAFPEDRLLRQFYRDLAAGQYDKALVEMRSLVDRDPYRADFLHELGNAYGKTGKLDSAKFYFERAIRLRPYNSLVRIEYGQLLMKSGEFEAALKTLKRAHFLNPEGLAIWEGIGLAYHRLGLMDSAMMIADTLFQMDSHSPGAHLLRMIVALKRGDRPEATRNYLEYKTFGASRSDYKNVIEYYRNLDTLKSAE